MGKYNPFLEAYEQEDDEPNPFLNPERYEERMRAMEFEAETPIRKTLKLPRKK